MLFVINHWCGSDRLQGVDILTILWTLIMLCNLLLSDPHLQAYMLFHTGNGIERVMKVLKQTAAREEDFVFSSLCESCDYQLAILEQAQIIQSFVERVSQETWWMKYRHFGWCNQRMLVNGLHQRGYCRDIYILVLGSVSVRSNYFLNCSILIAACLNVVD